MTRCATDFDTNGTQQLDFVPNIFAKNYSVFETHLKIISMEQRSVSLAKRSATRKARREKHGAKITAPEARHDERGAKSTVRKTRYKNRDAKSSVRRVRREEHSVKSARARCEGCSHHVIFRAFLTTW